MRTGKKMMINMVVLLMTMSAIYAAQDQGVAEKKPGVQLCCLADFSDLANGLAVAIPAGASWNENFCIHGKSC